MEPENAEKTMVVKIVDQMYGLTKPGTYELEQYVAFNPEKYNCYLARVEVVYVENATLQGSYAQITLIDEDMKDSDVVLREFTPSWWETVHITPGETETPLVIWELANRLAQRMVNVLSPIQA